MPITKLDQVQQRYLVKAPPEVKLDQVQQRYLVRSYETYPIRYTSTPIEYLLRGLSNEQYIAVKERYITFSDMLNLTDDPFFNTSIKLSVPRESGFKGEITLKYNKSSISDLILERDIVETFKPPLDDLFTTSDMLRHFNTHFGTKVPSTEILDSTIVGEDEVKLVASEESLLFIPGTEVSLGFYSGGDRYAALPKDTLTWSPEILEGIWTQGLDISLMHRGLSTTTNYTSTLSDGFIRQFYDDVTVAPTSTHQRLAGRALTQRSTTAPIISDRARTDCIYAMTILPLGTTVPIIFHYDSRQR